MPKDASPTSKDVVPVRSNTKPRVTSRKVLASTTKLKDLERRAQVNIEGVLAGQEMQHALPQLGGPHSEQQMMARATRLRMLLATGKRPVEIQKELGWTRSYYQCVRKWMTEVFKIEMGGIEVAEYLGWFRDVVLNEIRRLNDLEESGAIFRGCDLVYAADQRGRLADMLMERMMDVGFLPRAAAKFEHRHAHVAATVDDLKGLIEVAAKHGFRDPVLTAGEARAIEDTPTKALVEGTDGAWTDASTLETEEEVVEVVAETDDDAALLGPVDGEDLDLS